MCLFVLSQRDCELTCFHSQHRNATKACKGFVAESISAWPYGLLCLRGDLANPERDAICQIHPFLLRYLCNTPFMYPQQMADHLCVLSFKKKLLTCLALKCRISWESFFSLDIALFCDVQSWSCTKTHAWIYFFDEGMFCWRQWISQARRHVVVYFFISSVSVFLQCQKPTVKTMVQLC